MEPLDESSHSRSSWKLVSKRQTQRRIKSAVEHLFNTTSNSAGNAGNTFSTEQPHLCNIVTGHAGNLSSVESHIMEGDPQNPTYHCGEQVNGNSEFGNLHACYTPTMDADGGRSDSDSYVSDAASYATVDCYEDDYDYKDSCSISEEEDAEETFKNGLATWVVETNIARCHVNSLLKLLKTDGGLGYLPIDWRTLTKTQLPRGKLPFRDVPPGRYVHLGLANGIILSLFKLMLLIPPMLLKLTLAWMACR
ncbi:hypothetical protein DAPPUDRAFT_105706 [Daphnia pulex]|uniref:Uncharacterized protein n=1 Tax=Daphnia pulex TaxID=6669 RepID=E9GRJ6_DAPPU|nr:hypothetical protein DAPPUDRAFT_105706 [Daphnia pulex]|eukprot:EFX77903.1 hypothetical protein DAPPUDRAFT_105706 [Daphnia pulex]